MTEFSQLSNQSL